MERYHKVEFGSRKLSIYLPPTYLASDKSYPVVYMQDGGELFASGLNYMDMLFREGQLPEVIVVGIETNHRNTEYTPWPAAALVPHFPPFGGEGRAYVDMVADHIKPFIDGQYRTRSSREHTAMIGGSLGALISLFAGYWRPEVFGRIGLLSTSFWYEGVLEYVKEQGPPSDSLRIYMSVGSCEGIYKQTIQKHMVSYTLEARAAWLNQGFPSDQLRFEMDAGGTHDDIFMTKHVPDALRWLFGDASPLAARLSGTSPAASRYSLPRTETFMLRSSLNDRDYRIAVYVPAKPAPAEGYPVLYALDANAYFGSLSEAMQMQSRHPLGIAPGIIVGIGYDSDESFVTDRRFYDYTTRAAEGLKRPDGTDWPETGGADAFAAFIEQQLKPEIERRYPINRAQQALFGHSLGRLFTLRTLMNRPEAYQTYVAGSPSIWWNDAELMSHVPEFLHMLETDKRALKLLIAVGSEEKPMMIEHARDLVERLKAGEDKGLKVSFASYEGEGHVSVIQPLISRMYRDVFQHRRTESSL